jgi:hypothetical protein
MMNKEICDLPSTLRTPAGTKMRPVGRADCEARFYLSQRYSVQRIRFALMDIEQGKNLTGPSNQMKPTSGTSNMHGAPIRRQQNGGCVDGRAR